MRGSPLFRAVVCFVVLLGLWPVVVKVTAGGRETGEPSPVAPMESSEGAQSVSCVLEVRMTAPCRGLVVQHLGTELLAVKRLESEFEREVKLEFPAQGVDLVIRWDWGTVEGQGDASKVRPGEHAARFRLRMPDGRVEERTVWGSGAVEEVLSFGGKGA
jgi:hypothetical protein